MIKPFGFKLDDKKLRRAGLDYHEWANITVHEHIDDIASITTQAIYAISTKGNVRYDQASFKAGDSFIFGPETRGLPSEYLVSTAENNVLRIPMLADSRSLNLSNTVAIVIYEAMGQLNFDGLL